MKLSIGKVLIILARVTVFLLCAFLVAFFQSRTPYLNNVVWHRIRFLGRVFTLARLRPMYNMSHLTPKKIADIFAFLESGFQFCVCMSTSLPSEISVHPFYQVRGQLQRKLPREQSVYCCSREWKYKVPLVGLRRSMNTAWTASYICEGKTISGFDFSFVLDDC